MWIFEPTMRQQALFGPSLKTVTRAHIGKPNKYKGSKESVVYQQYYNQEISDLCKSNGWAYCGFEFNPFYPDSARYLTYTECLSKYEYLIKYRVRNKDYNVRYKLGVQDRIYSSQWVRKLNMVGISMSPVMYCYNLRTNGLFWMDQEYIPGRMVENRPYQVVGPRIARLNSFFSREAEGEQCRPYSNDLDKFSIRVGEVELRNGSYVGIRPINAYYTVEDFSKELRIQELKELEGLGLGVDRTPESVQRALTVMREREWDPRQLPDFFIKPGVSNKAYVLGIGVIAVRMCAENVPGRLEGMMGYITEEDLTIDLATHHACTHNDREYRVRTLLNMPLLLGLEKKIEEANDFKSMAHVDVTEKVSSGTIMRDMAEAINRERSLRSSEVDWGGGDSG